MKRFPSTTLIRLYELLKNDSRSFDRTGNPSSDDLPVRTKFGGGERDRTDDPLLAKQVLSQLSYTPGNPLHHHLTRPESLMEMVGLDGLEPSTPALSRRCSNQLSYRPADTSAN